MNIYIIYKITNKINNKSYIGFTSDTIQGRFDSHWRNAKTNPKTYLHRSMHKHGKENFFIESLYESKDNQHTLHIMEPFFISEYDTFLGEGYNMTEGGDKNIGMTGKTHTSEAKAKMSKTRKGKPKSAEWRAKISKSMKGRKLSATHKENISKANTKKS